MIYWHELDRREVDGMTVILETAPEDSHPRDSFDDTCYDIDQICRDIDSERYQWFQLRARALVDGTEMGRAGISCLLYEDAREVLRDGIADHVIYEAVANAQQRSHALIRALQKIVDKLEARVQNSTIATRSSL